VDPAKRKQKLVILDVRVCPNASQEARLDSVFLVNKPPLQLGLGFARKFICILSEQFRL
jgi:hypothetical protein